MIAYSLLFPYLSYLHAVARRHPYFYAPELLYYAEKQSAIMTECCAEADKAACLGPKVIPGQTAGLNHSVFPASVFGYLRARFGTSESLDETSLCH